MKRILLPILLIICVSCHAQKEIKFTTQTLNLKGDIKHIIEKTGDRTWNLEFKNNRLLSVKENFHGTTTRNNHRFQYEGEKLINIYNGSYVVSSEIFSNNFEMRLPLNGYHKADSLVRNDFGDIVQVFFKDAIPHEYRIDYTYDRFNNWK